MRKLISLLCALPFVSAAQVQEPVYLPSYRMTLEDCLNYAYGNNYNRQIYLLNEEVYEEIYDQSKMEKLPSVSASVNESLSHSRGNSAVWSGNYGVNTSLSLYEGGSRNTTIEQNRLRMEQSGYQTDQYDNTLTIQILQSFLSVIGNQELLNYQEAVVRASEQQVREGREQYLVGAVLESDYLMLAAQYASDSNNIRDTRIAIENGLLSLKTLLSMDPTWDLEIIPPDTSVISSLAYIPDREDVLERAMITLPDLRISQYNVDIAVKNVELAKSAFLPTVSVGAGIGTGHSDFSRYGSQLSDRLNEQIGLTVSIPIFNKGATRSRVTQNRIALQQAELDDLQTRIDVRENVISEYLNVISSYNNYEVSRTTEDAYYRNFMVYRAKFDAGSVTVVDLLQQQNNYISVLNTYIQNKYDFILRRKILDVYMGIPISM